MISTLKANGYLPADPRHPPTLFLHFRWGSFNKLNSMDDPTGSNGDDADNPSAPDDLMLQNMVERAGLVGGTTFAVEMIRAMNAGTLSQFSSRDPRTNWLMNQVYSNRYFVIASAYDFAAARKGLQVLLWRTKISSSSQGVTMDETIPSIMASAGPYLGRETTSPVRLNRPVVKEGVVEIGTPTVKSYSDPSQGAGTGDNTEPKNP